jgi:hypothetical protein
MIVIPDQNFRHEDVVSIVKWKGGHPSNPKIESKGAGKNAELVLQGPSFGHYHHVNNKKQQ